MMKVSRWIAVSALLVALFTLSLYGCYFFIRMPLTRYRTNVDLRYTQSADYSYTAFVKPSLLYDNRTEVSEGDPLYVKLVERLNVTFQYELTQEPNTVSMTDNKLKYEVSASLSGGDWAKIYPLSSRRTNTTGFIETYTLNITEIEGIIDTIGEEIGTRAHSYTYEIRPLIRLDASAGNESIEQDFNPTLTIKFELGQIKFKGLTNTMMGSVTHREKEAATYKILGLSGEVSDMRGISIIVAIALSVMLFYSGRSALRERESRTFRERLSRDIREKIIEVQEPPERIERSTIVVDSLGDLARVAEEAFKTIIHHKGVFYVLDGYVRYEFKMEAEADGTGEEELQRQELLV